LPSVLKPMPLSSSLASSSVTTSAYFECNSNNVALCIMAERSPHADTTTCIALKFCISIPHHRSKSVTHSIQSRSPHTTTGTHSTKYQSIHNHQLQFRTERCSKEGTWVLFESDCIPRSGLQAWQPRIYATCVSVLLDSASFRIHILNSTVYHLRPYGWHIAGPSSGE
jgi:hypothetical protein